MSATRIILGLAAVLALGACEQELILPGERYDTRAPLDSSLLGGEGTQEAVAQNRAEPISLPAPVVSQDWTHKAGGPTHRIAHQALSAVPQPVWSVAIGQGNSRRHRITAQPVVSGGRIFTMDSRATVAATSTAGGRLWSRDLTPATDRPDDVSGGGLAVAGSRLYVTTGFGELVALDAASGGEIWRQRLGASASGSPTVLGDTVYAVGRDNRAWAVAAADGKVRWSFTGAPSVAGFIGPAGPMATPDLVVFPFSSNQLAAARPDGTRAWVANLAGRREGRVYARISEVLGDPVLVDGVIYTGTQSGQIAAINSQAGNLIWSAPEGAYGPLVVAGGAVFAINDQSQLVRLEARTGEVVWAADLPYYTRERLRRRRDIYAHFGPVLAGGRLWVASDDSTLRAFSPESGGEIAGVPLPGGAATPPVVVGRTLYVVSKRGQLLAFR